MGDERPVFSGWAYCYTHERKLHHASCCHTVGFHLGHDVDCTCRMAGEWQTERALDRWLVRLAAIEAEAEADGMLESVR